MKKNIPQVWFNSSVKERSEFEIVAIDKIRAMKETLEVHPEHPHQIKFYNIVFFTEGEGQHLVDFKLIPVKKNCLLYIAKDQINAFQLSHKLKGVCILFTQEYFASCFPDLPKGFLFRLFTPQLFSPLLQIPQESPFITYLNLLHEEYININSFNKSNILKSLFIALISKAEEIKQAHTLHIKDSGNVMLIHHFFNLLELHFRSERNATFYANELAISYKHLNQVCKNLLNQTAKSLIDDFIILQAKRRLINSSVKSTELSFELGFDEPTNFSKYFKKHTGLTPKSFKKEHQN